MATVNVRQLDDHVVQRLKRRAAANNRSLESEARHILSAAAGRRYGDEAEVLPRASCKTAARHQGSRTDTL